MDNLMDKLGRELLFFDGAMGTALQAKGLPIGELPELWNLRHPEIIEEIHGEFLSAGCSLIETNTFGANRYKLEPLGYSVAAVVAAAVNAAKTAVGTSNRDAWVALSVGPSGKLLAPLGDLAFEDAVSLFSEMVTAGANAGADCVLIETMSDLYEAKAAVLAAKESSSLPVFVTMTYDEQGRLLTGGDIAVAAAVLEGLGVDALGINCGLGPEQMVSLVDRLRETVSLPIIVNPNAGLPVERDGKTCYEVNPEEFAGFMREIVRHGAAAVGGCCGTTPAHIAETVSACRDVSLVSPSCKRKTVVTSGSRAVFLGGRPVIIGERINPTGKLKFKQALREKDIAYILNEGITQQDAGADILDVNVGLPEIDEPAIMCEVIRELQSICDLPLQIDTADPRTMEQAMRLYNGIPLINSVTAKRSSMESIFPLVKKYGGVVIGLTITENGIPETAEGRLEAARVIVETAAQFGIPKENLVIDPLTMAVSAGQEAARVTLQALNLIQSELGVYTSLGVSNVSFGLPRRENINSAFFLLALHNGLKAAIINPKSEAMMTAYRSFCALSGDDPNCMAYIESFSQTEASGPVQATDYSLHTAIEKGLKEASAQAAEKLTETLPALEIINEEIIPALDCIGEKFEKGTLYLPQLLMGADAAKAAFEVIKGKLGSRASSENSRLTIVLATVKGDVHDIGKNIVKVLLENYGFTVIDLGKDVAPELVLKAAKEKSAGLVGLSALMTTTVVNMKETILLLKRELPDCKVMVGGAVLNQEYADMIGADFYGKDAMASVRYAQELLESLGH